VTRHMGQLCVREGDRMFMLGQELLDIVNDRK